VIEYQPPEPDVSLQEWVWPPKVPVEPPKPRETPPKVLRKKGAIVETQTDRLVAKASDANRPFIEAGVTYRRAKGLRSVSTNGVQVHFREWVPRWETRRNPARGVARLPSWSVPLRFGSFLPDDHLVGPLCQTPHMPPFGSLFQAGFVPQFGIGRTAHFIESSIEFLNGLGRPRANPALAVQRLQHAGSVVELKGEFIHAYAHFAQVVQLPVGRPPEVVDCLQEKSVLAGFRVHWMTSALLGPFTPAE
jgi:hypothetical protein